MSDENSWEDWTRFFEQFLYELDQGNADIQFGEIPGLGRRLSWSGGGAFRASQEVMRKYSDVIKRIDDGEVDVVEEVDDDLRGYFVELCSHVDGLRVDVDELREDEEEPLNQGELKPSKPDLKKEYPDGKIRSEMLMELEVGDGVFVEVSDERSPTMPQLDPFDTSFVGVVGEVDVSGSEGNQSVTVSVDVDQVVDAEDDWLETLELRTHSEDGVWRRPGVWIRTSSSPTVGVGDEEIGGGPGWRGLGMLGEVERI